MGKRNIYGFAGIIFGVIGLNLIAWHSRAFCDFYVKYIFPLWVNTYGRITGFAPFSVGEIMLVLGVLLVFFALLFGVAALLFGTVFRNTVFAQNMKRYTVRFYRGFAWLLAGVMLVMTLNCFVLYHCTSFDEKYLTTAEKDYTLEELTALRDFIVSQANALSGEVTRDEAGRIIYEGDMGGEAILAMKNLGNTYEQLSGYYPKPKAIASSEFLSQQHMKGYYFPFSMEANYNAVMDTMNKPATMCHELAHLKGFICEDEANLIGFLACIQSEDVTFQYSGYLSVLNYIDNDFYESVNRSRAVYKSHVQIKPQVKKDNVFLTEESWEKVEKKAVIKTETVKKAAGTFIDTTLVLNGIEDGSLSYTRVVGLMMNYYESNYEFYENGTYLVKEDI